MIDDRDLIGVPWIEGGRDPLTGLDCLGLVLEVARRLGIPAQEPETVVREYWEHGRDIDSEAFPTGWRETAAPWTLGDVLVICERDAPTHLGIVVPIGWCLHATEGQGVVRTPIARLGTHIVKGFRWSPL